MHELIHASTTLTDPDIQRALFGTSGGVSGNITNQLKLDCYDQ
jgi:hypothetical protein